MGRQFTKKVPKDSKIHLRRSSGGAHRRNEEPKSIRGVVNDYADVKRGATEFLKRWEKRNKIRYKRRFK